MRIDGSQGLERALSEMLDGLEHLSFENAVIRMLVQHAVAIHVLRSGNVRAYFEAIRETSRTNLERVAFEPDALEDAETIRARVLARHDRMFDEVARALRLRTAAALDEPLQPQISALARAGTPNPAARA